jgi:hypothetical protein
VLTCGAKLSATGERRVVECWAVERKWAEKEKWADGKGKRKRGGGGLLGWAERKGGGPRVGFGVR